MTTPEPGTPETSNPLTRSTPLGGRTGILLLIIPIVFLIVYGPHDRSRRR